MRALLVLGVLAAGNAVGLLAQAAPAAVVPVFVHTEDTGESSELAARLASVKDLTAALAAKKKTMAVADTVEQADLFIEVVSRGLVVPKVVIGLGPRPGDPPGARGVVRTAVLQVQVRQDRDGKGVDFRNKNKPNDNPRGWKSAADDLADQIEKWIRERRVGQSR
jgi:lauroyl/myristoyl acyltransferase